jgi:serine/threonine protein kinase
MQAARYLLNECLNDGPDASVWSAYDLSAGIDVCVKVSKSSVQVPRELEALSSLAHPSIIPLLDHFQVENIDSIDDVLVFPLANYSLIDCIIDCGPIDESIVRRIVYALLDALALVHARGFWHQDVKPDNVLVMGDRLTGSNCVLADFGFATFLGCGNKTHSRMGTRQYAAPEQVLDEECGQETDIWALGVTMFTCLSGEWPFRSGDSDDDFILEEIANGLPGWEDGLPDVSAECRDLLGRLLQRDRCARITASDAMSHRWFAGIGDEMRLSPND